MPIGTKDVEVHSIPFCYLRNVGSLPIPGYGAKLRRLWKTG